MTDGGLEVSDALLFSDRGFAVVATGDNKVGNFAGLIVEGLAPGGIVPTESPHRVLFTLDNLAVLVVDSGKSVEIGLLSVVVSFLLIQAGVDLLQGRSLGLTGCFHSV